MFQSPPTNHSEHARVRVALSHEPANRNNTSMTQPASPSSSLSNERGSNNKRLSGIQSKVGSLERADYKPQPSQVKIQTFKQDLSSVQSKVGSLSQIDYKPKPSQVRVVTYKSRDLSGIQSKVGSMDQIGYKPKPSQVKVASYKQDLSHVRPKIDARLDMPLSPSALEGGAGGEKGDEGAAPAPAAQGNRGHARRTSTSTSGTNAPSKPTATPRPRTRQASAPVLPSRAAIVSPTPAAPVPRRSSASAASTTSASSSSSSLSSATSTRRLSRHVLPSQKLPSFDHIKPKVGSLENIQYNRDRPTAPRPASRASENGSANTSSGLISPHQRRSPSPHSTTSSSSPSNSSRRSSLSGTTSSSVTTSPIKRVPSFKIPDFSKVKAKVGSLDNAGHKPLGGDIRVFHEKLSFREKAQSKIAREINIASFYQDMDNSILEEEDENVVEGGQEQEQQQEQKEADDQVSSAVHRDHSEALFTALEGLTKELDGAKLRNDTQSVADSPAIHL